MAAIRVLGPDDWRLYRDLRLRALADAPDAFGSTLAQEQGRSDAAWRERLEEAHGSRWNLPLVAEEGAAAVGLAWGRIEPAEPGTARLYQMWVAPGSRQLGLGGRLLDEIVRWATAAGASRLALAVTRGNGAAVRLYARAGFTPVGAPEPLRPGSALESQPMERALGSGREGR